VIVVRHPAGFAAERAYAAHVVLREFLGIDHRLEPHEQSWVRLALDGDDERYVDAPDVLFATAPSEWLTERTLPRLPLTTVAAADGLTLPILFGDADDGAPAFAYERGRARLGLDVLGSAFFMLTRYEELVPSPRDEHDRFRTDRLLAARAGFLGVPIVDEYVAVLDAAIAAVWPRLPRSRPVPRVAISHDVDWPLCTRGPFASVARDMASDARAGDPLLGLRRGVSALRVRRGDLDTDVCNTFDELMELSESIGHRSAFFFIASEDGDHIDGDYSLEEAWVRRLLRRIAARGHEIGVHPGYRTYADAALTARAFERLRAVCSAESIVQEQWGGRQHFLRWSNPATWQAWADAGLDYDSTLGLSDDVGFRSGTCREHTTFNLRTREHLPLRERPLLVMDVALTRSTRSTDEALERVDRLRRACRRHEGCFTLLWHNNRFCSRRDRALYRAIMGRL
jgi:hypothetical protein